ncbi:MAG: GIY-YIG nuclease family protein [Chloroflexota bacterium]|nr:GIY-YIG nuclease family protein [Chloroflexota bacterium]
MQEPLTASHFVYVVRCANGTLYAGYTTNVDRRLATHNAGRGARYTRGLLPVELLAAWAFETKSAALRAERRVKRLPRDQKLALIAATPKDPGSISPGEQSGVLASMAT